jgi:ATP-dependent helicase HrpA
VDEEVLVAFYKERLPGVCDIRTLKHRIRQKGGDGFLRLNREMLIHYSPDRDVLAQFPETLDLGNRVLDCDYAFTPGEETDGVTLNVPTDVGGDLSRAQLDWLVPGLLEEKITALIRGLPKVHRVKLVPVADTVRTILDRMPKGRESLPSALSRFLFEHMQVNIPASAWPVEDLPDHLKMRFSITDANGKVVASGRDVRLLDRHMSTTADAGGMHKLKRQWERRGIRAWDFGDLPESIESTGSGGDGFCGYPRLTISDGGISIRLFGDRQAAEAAHQKGVAALLERFFCGDLKFLKKNIKLPTLLNRQCSYFGGSVVVNQQLYACVTQELLAKPILKQADFQAHVEDLTTMRLHQCGQDLRDAVIAVVEAHHEVRCRISDVEKKRIAAPAVSQFIQDLKAEAGRLVPDNFVTLYDRQRLSHLVRYLNALSIRTQRGLADLEKDRARQAMVAPFVDQLARILTTMDATTSEQKRESVEAYFWMIEEYKVSVFAQEVGTDGPVSAKRLKKLIGEIERLI